MKRILLISDSAVLHTGFGNIARKLLMHLHNIGKYKLGQLAWFHHDTDIKLPEDIEIYSPTKEDFFGEVAFEQVIEHFQPDIVITISDLFMVYYVKGALARKTFKWIGYIPIDGEPLLPKVMYNIFSANVLIDIEVTLKDMDYPISYSEYGKRVVNESGFIKIDKVISCGVDTEIFKPVPYEQKGKFKKDLLNLSPNSFVVGFVGRNSMRKRPDRLMSAFAQFAKNKSNVYLYMHCALEDYTGFNLPALAKEYGIAGKIVFNGQLIVGQGFSDNILAMYYNAMDVMALPTSSEGFCLPLLEAMSCGVPILATDYSAHVEWCKAGGELIAVKDFEREPRTNIKRALIDVDDLAKRLEKLYNDEFKRKMYGKFGRQQALEMDWKKILLQWEELIDSIELSSKKIEVNDSKVELL